MGGLAPVARMHRSSHGTAPVSRRKTRRLHFGGLAPEASRLLLLLSAPRGLKVIIIIIGARGLKVIIIIVIGARGLKVVIIIINGAPRPQGGLG